MAAITSAAVGRASARPPKNAPKHPPNALPPSPGAPPPPAVARWYRMSDAKVSVVDEAAVLGAEAFLLFYERET